MRSPQARAAGISVALSLGALAVGGESQPLRRGPEARDGWKQASREYRLTLPRDHASHPDYKIEWWYYTGHLRTNEGRRFGYQLTFFRVGVDLEPANPSRWAVRDLHMAHFAITDVEAGRHLSAERLNRAGVAWAGAATERYRVWNESWEVEREGNCHLLRAADNRIALDLRLVETASVLHGAAGYSRKGATPGNASHYYSMTRMPTRGALRVGGQRFEVTGTSWMDHEFGTSFLEASQQGWDWFALSLDDGTDLMMFQLRARDGTVDPRSSGTLVTVKGARRVLAPGAFSLEPGRSWRSPESGAVYPVAWRIRVPADRLDLRLTPLLDAQEMRMPRSGVAYWEGAIVVDGRRGDRPVTGRGYLEMTGYAGGAMGELMR